MRLKPLLSFDNLAKSLDCVKWPLNLKAFLVLRVVTFLGMLLAAGLFFIMGNRLADLIFFSFLIVFWFVSSLLVDFFFVAVGRILQLRCAVFAMVDVYIMLSFFSYAGNAMMPAICPFAGYVVLAAASGGLFVGVLAAIAGFIAFLQGYVLQIDINFWNLVLIIFIAVAALLCAMAWRLWLPRLLGHMRSRMISELDSPAESSIGLEKIEKLQARMEKIQEQLDKVSIERGNALELADELKKKLEAAGATETPKTPEKEAVTAEKTEEVEERQEKTATDEPEEKTEEKGEAPTTEAAAEKTEEKTEEGSNEDEAQITAAFEKAMATDETTEEEK